MTAPMKPVFTDPPLAFGGSSDVEWAPTIAALIEKTGEWALIFVGDYKDANRLIGRIRKSRYAWAGHEWEVTARNTLSSTDAKVWARHIKPLDTPHDEGDNA